MPENKYKVELSEIEIEKLKEITRKGKITAREIMHANILLNTNDNAENKKNNEKSQKYSIYQQQL